MNLDRTTREELIELLAPLMANPADRQALLFLAFGEHSNLVGQIDTSGPQGTFIPNLIARLSDFGEIESGQPALWALLEAARDRMGVDRQARVDALRPALGVSETASPGVLRAYYQSRINAWSADRYALDKRFVQLTLLLDQGDDAQGMRWQASRQFNDLQDVLAEAPDQALVLLGPPGSGKSTLLRHFELDTARGGLERESSNAAPLTFFVSLNRYKAQPGESLPEPKAWLSQVWSEQFEDLPALDDLLHERRLTLLLDALNEIPANKDRAIASWKDFLARLAVERPGNRVIFSCRSLDYSASLSTRELPVPQVRIEQLSDEQVQRFVTQYSEQHGEMIWQALQGSRQLELLRSPYYLKLLVEQVEATGEVPQGRAALFSGFVREAIKREILAENPLFAANELLKKRDCQRVMLAKQWKTPHELPERGILVPKLSGLAFGMQETRTEGEAAQVRVDFDTALDLLDHVRAEDLLQAGVGLSVLEQDLGRDEVLFVHQLLQEYFAARQLARTPEPERVQVAWRASEVVPDLQTTISGLADADPLPLLPGTGWEETTVLAAAMAEKPDRFVADLMDVNLPLAGRCAAQPDVPVSAEITEKIRRALVERTRDPQADLRARIAAGLALGELGDSRFERCSGPEGDYLLPPMIAIAAGCYPIGSDEGIEENEAPVHQVELVRFEIGQFPVTNAEWRLFMEAGGYEDERWWSTEAARAWRRGEGTAEGPKQRGRELRQRCRDNYDRLSEEFNWWTSEEVERWRGFVDMSDEAFEQVLDKNYPAGRQTEPRYWNDGAYNNPAQPVVGICWYEAQAYCAWLSARSGRCFRLPSEVEWEAAARGLAGRTFAYGEQFDAGRCNTFESHIRRPTPIGVFSGGETPEGLVDMTGNVWEWTGSLYESYPYRSADGRENPEGEARRVVRGGGWHGSQAAARAAYRHHRAPNDRHNFSGIRLARLPP